MKTTTKELKELIKKKIEERYHELRIIREKELAKVNKKILEEYEKLCKQCKIIQNRKNIISKSLYDKYDASPRDDGTINYTRNKLFSINDKYNEIMVEIQYEKEINIKQILDKIKVLK